MNYGKVFLALLLFLTSTCHISCVEKNDDIDINAFFAGSRIADNKVYLEPGMIYVAPNQILLNIQGNLIPIENLSVDEVGIFVTVEAVVRAAQNRADRWTCPRCNKVNSMENQWCTRCGS